MRITATTELVNLLKGQYRAITAVEIGQYSVENGTPVKVSSRLYHPEDLIEISEGWYYLEPGDELLTPLVAEIERID